MAGWAKAPSFADDPARIAEIQAQTERDKSRYLVDGATPVECSACGISVQVRKHSVQHTSIQWTADPGQVCQEYQSPTYTRGVRTSCSRLRKSIEHAVQEGIVHVADNVG